MPMPPSTTTSRCPSRLAKDSRFQWNVSRWMYELHFVSTNLLMWWGNRNRLAFRVGLSWVSSIRAWKRVEAEKMCEWGLAYFVYAKSEWEKVDSHVPVRPTSPQLSIKMPPSWKLHIPSFVHVTDFWAFALVVRRLSGSSSPSVGLSFYFSRNPVSYTMRCIWAFSRYSVK